MEGPRNDLEFYRVVFEDIDVPPEEQCAYDECRGKGIVHCGECFDRVCDAHFIIKISGSRYAAHLCLDCFYK